MLLHGFGGTPDEMLQLGKFLADRGISVYGVRLAGHGTSPADLKGISYRHWIESALEGLQELRKNCKKVYAAGLSTGGTISLHIAATSPLDGVIAICAPVYLDLRLYLKRPLRFTFQFGREVDRNIKDPAARKNHLAYKSVPLKAIFEFLALLRLVRSELHSVTAPVLLLQSRDDQVVARENASYIYNRLTGAAAIKIIWLERSGHMATVDYDKGVVFQSIYNFITDLNNQGGITGTP
ncbi:MAG: alpha/beta hydrolase [Eubacteriales bacterium]